MYKRANNKQWVTQLRISVIDRLCFIRSCTQK